MRKTLSILLAFAGLLMFFHASAQRGKIVKASTTSVLDPNGDGYVSRTTAGFSNDGYYVDEFEIPMFGLPKSEAGEVLNDIQAGANCGTTELTYDAKGFSVYGVLKSGNLIFRFRVAKDQPSVEAYTILIDTDGLIGSDDPNSTPENPGFEIDITMIKNQTKGIYVYNIDGIDFCPNELLNYDLDSHFQIAVADEVSCSDPDYFYDFYVPFQEVADKLSIADITELRFVALTNVSATCAMAGKISDIGGVDDTPYNGCNACAFVDLVTNQCPTALVNLCPTCDGFRSGVTPRPSINTPLKAGEFDITGKSVANAEVFVRIFDISKSLKESETVIATSAGTWVKVLASPLAIGDSITAQAKAFGQCNSGRSSSGTSFTIVVQNIPPVLAGPSSTLQYNENASPLQLASSITLTDIDDTEIESATVNINGGFNNAEDKLTSTPSGGVSGSYNTTTGVLTLTGTASLATYQSILRTVGYSNSSDNPTTTLRTFNMVVNDGLDNSNVFNISIQVVAVNDPPAVSSPINIVQYAGAALVVNNSLTISDLDNTQLTGATVSISSNFIVTEDQLTFTNQNGISGSYNTPTGVLTLTGTASIANYALALSTIKFTNSNGSPSPQTRSVSFVVNDGTNNSNTFQSFVDFPGINNPPVIVDENGNPIEDLNYTIDEDTELNACVAASDPDGDPIAIESFTNATSGEFTITEGLCFKFIPDANYNGTVTATITVCDQVSGQLCDLANVSITIVPVNDAPVIEEVTISVEENSTTQICLVYTDVENDEAIFTDGSLSNDSGSIVNDNLNDACFIYTPKPGFVGRDTVTVTLCDPNDITVCTSGVVYIDVNEADNHPPETLINGIPGDTIHVQIWEDSTAVICFESIDPDGDDVVLSSIQKLSGGGGDISLYQDIEFCFLYTPLENFNGTIVWQIDVCDYQVPSLCGTVKFILDVLPINDPPIAVTDTLIVTRNKEGTINILANDFDIEGDEITLNPQPVEEPQHGTYTLAADGELTYVSNRYYVGNDFLKYSICDNGTPALCNEGLVLIQIEDVPLKVYEGFSPNGDGLNDYWRIEGVDFYPENVVQVFDRYNNLVFQLNGYNNENKMWRGESNHGLTNGRLPEGTYFYAINLGTGGSLLKGFVVLKRE